jgi:hypothetical protein
MYSDKAIQVGTILYHGMYQFSTVLYHVCTGFVVNSLGMYCNVLGRQAEFAHSPGHIRGIARGIARSITMPRVCTEYIHVRTEYIHVHTVLIIVCTWYVPIPTFLYSLKRGTY